MDFSFSESQNILLKSAKDFLRKEARNYAREIEKSDEGHSTDLWRKMAELGWIGVVFPETYGGIDGNFLDTVLILEEMGKALVPGPFISTVISGLSILQYGNSLQKQKLLPELVNGDLIVTYAMISPGRSFNGTEIEEEVRLMNNGYILSGTRLFSPFAHIANWIIFGSETDGGKTLFLINRSSQGVKCIPLESIANNGFCEVRLKDVEVPETDILGVVGEGTKIISKIEEWGALAESAFISGMQDRVLEMSVAYAKEREQFGKRIGSFQAIQHQCADMAADIEQIKLLTYHAAWRLSENLPARKEICMAKGLASDASRRVCLLGVKIHGGTGVSEEHDMQLYFRWAKAAEQAFGDGDFHREIVADELGL
jgi:alkylation response protein AidB-like acyl-CoA dehydrogenase